MGNVCAKQPERKKAEPETGSLVAVLKESYPQYPWEKAFAEWSKKCPKLAKDGTWSCAVMTECNKVIKSDYFVSRQTSDLKAKNLMWTIAYDAVTKRQLRRENDQMGKKNVAAAKHLAEKNKEVSVLQQKVIKMAGSPHAGHKPRDDEEAESDEEDAILGGFEDLQLMMRRRLVPAAPAVAELGGAVGGIEDEEEAPPPYLYPDVTDLAEGKHRESLEKRNLYAKCKNTAFDQITAKHGINSPKKFKKCSNAKKKQLQDEINQLADDLYKAAVGAPVTRASSKLVNEAPMIPYPNPLAGVDGGAATMEIFRPWTSSELAKIASRCGDPNPSKQGIEAFMRELRMVCGSYSPNSTDMRQLLSLVLQERDEVFINWYNLHGGVVTVAEPLGEAPAILWPNLNAQPNNTPEFRANLLNVLERYLRTKYPKQTIWPKINAVKQEDNETVDSYLQRLRKAVAEYSGLEPQPAEALLPSLFVGGLNSKVQDKLKTHTPDWSSKTLDALVQLSKHYQQMIQEKAAKSKKRGITVSLADVMMAQPQFPQQMVKRTPQNSPCAICGKLGHWAKDCRSQPQRGRGRGRGGYKGGVQRGGFQYKQTAPEVPPPAFNPTYQAPVPPPAGGYGHPHQSF